MTYSEDDLLPISALQHLVFCPRQWALIHLEGVWTDNVLTAEGSLLHEHAHSDESESRGDVRISRALRLRSLRLGLVGQADVVEFHRSPDSQHGVSLPALAGLWIPWIVEYKHGRPKIGHEDEIQLCAQALCLEEMLCVDIPQSSFFYGQPRRRQDTLLTPELRAETEQWVAELHAFNTAAVTPEPEYSVRCRSCSLEQHCLPRAVGRHRSVNEYIRRQLEGMEGPS
jgi:CRISPR-associated exonuclease Cas4